MRADDVSEMFARHAGNLANEPRLLVQLHPVARRLGAVATCGHVAPAAPAILGLVLKHAAATRIGAAPHSQQFTQDECVRRAFDNIDQKARECVSDGNEGAGVAAITLYLYPTSA